jgi:3',5'-cyclic AMP phosphodiesterase CpdA
LKKELFFKNDGTFKILQFTDIHFSEDNETDHRTTELMRQLIEQEKPDFIITTGDTVYGPYNTLHIEKALSPMIESGIPWSYTFGNHDTEEGDDYATLFPMITGLPNCITYNADDSIGGTGNHYIEVKNQQGETKWVLFGMDSGAYNQIPSIGGYDYIKENQIHWYKKMIVDFEVVVPSFSALVFMHIALPEYNEVWDFETCYGEKREEVCCPRINSGLFAGMQEVGHTKGVFVGHDHVNDYMGSLYGITLAYGRATGYNTYGQDDYRKGARIIQLDVNNTESFETYIRLEDGTVLKEQKEHKPERLRK